MITRQDPPITSLFPIFDLGKIVAAHLKRYLGTRVEKR